MLKADSLIDFTLRDFSLRENHLAGYPSFLMEEHNKRYAVRSVALTHPKIALQSVAYLNIKSNLAFCSQRGKIQ